VGAFLPVAGHGDGLRGAESVGGHVDRTASGTDGANGEQVRGGGFRGGELHVRVGSRLHGVM